MLNHLPNAISSADNPLCIQTPGFMGSWFFYMVGVTTESAFTTVLFPLDCKQY